METTDRRETTEAAAIAVPPDGGATVWLLGDTYTLKIAGEQTGGAFACGPGGHRYRFVYTRVLARYGIRAA